VPERWFLAILAYYWVNLCIILAIRNPHSGLDMLLRKIINPLILLAILFSSVAGATEWPQELPVEGGTIVIYQPQPESLSGKTLKGRAAMAIERKGSAEPIFGVFWFSANIETDRSNDTATTSDVKVTKVTWPDSRDTGEQRFTAAVEAALTDAVFEHSLSSLTAALAVSDDVQKSLEDIKNDPPQVKFTQTLAVLLLFDGKPRFSPVENSPYERALNTPLVVVKDTSSKQYYLTSGSLWYQARDALGPWKQTTSPPADLVKMIPASDDAKPAGVPEIVVATEPTELIVSDGKPEWTSLDGGQLLYVKNTETPWIRDLSGGNMYVQLSGRWYRGKQESGPWTFVRSDKLPESFAQIPPASDIGGVRTSVAGTPEADEAVADAQIPQTAAIQRDKASLQVTYDGAPRFEAIKGTDVAYAVNTGSQVLRIDGKFYAVDNGVWFTADAAQGPWRVADSVPADKIAKIPPSSPVYNTTYVTIYDSTPNVVYVGYTPGYLWSFPYYGVPVYGTGWYYPPYYGPGVYYPRAPTWGFNVGYNPWTGWSFGVSWGGPFMRVGVSWGGGYHHGYYPGRCCGGWYGGGYRHNDININTGDINIGNNVSIGNRTNIENKVNRNKRNTNIYRDKNNQDRIASRDLVKKDVKKARSNPARKNNVFADRNGQVARKDADQWQVRKDDKWQSVAHDKKPAQRPANKVAPSRDIPKRDTVKRPSQRPQLDTHRMNRDFSARQRGSRSGGFKQRAHR
tara:strand:- start:46689 stop:48908 length:2220 start_codon:yes stop_codon:yes gene_type:complete